jgi:quercetin dioxygenase-like cupin family protein
MLNSEYLLIPELTQEIQEISPDSIVSRTILNDEDLKVILFGFAPGQELSEHTAAKPAIIQIIQGEAQITLGEDTFNAKEGLWLHMPANLPHSVHAKTTVQMILVLIK